MTYKGLGMTVVFSTSFFVSVSLSVESLLGCNRCLSDSPRPGGSIQPTIYKDKKDTRSICRTWYTIHQGETQWDVATQFAPQGRNKQEWLKSMRYMSHKAPDDQLIKPGENVCVEW